MKSSLNHCILYSHWIHPSRKVNVRGITYTAAHHPYPLSYAGCKTFRPGFYSIQMIGSSIRIHMGQSMP